MPISYRKLTPLGRWLALFFMAVLTVVSLFTALLRPAGAKPADFTVGEVFLQNFFALAKASGQFRQIGPGGEVSFGDFYLERPGKIRFSYKNSPLEIIADGKSVAIYNKNLGNWQLYNLSQTPLKFLLSERLDPTLNLQITAQKMGKITKLLLRGEQLGANRFELFFNNKSKALMGWVVHDQQNLKTRVNLSNIRTNIVFAKNMFTIPYQAIAMQRKD